jgi:hypothetical protein
MVPTDDPELGEDFLRAVQEALASIQDNPLRCQIVYGNGRRVGLRRFKEYRLIYMAENKIVMLSSFHGRRNPKRWQDRLR